MAEYDHRWQAGKGRKTIIADMESRPCSTCGARPCEPCHTITGTRKTTTHRARWRTVSVRAVNITVRTDALIHDLAIIVGGCLHPYAQIGPAPRLATNRVRDVLGITPGELTAGIEDRLTAALAADGSSVSVERKTTGERCEA